MAKKIIEVYDTGTKVKIGAYGDMVPGIVTAVAIYDWGVQYQVAWWNGRDRKSEWLNHLELKFDAEAEGNKREVGFK